MLNNAFSEIIKKNPLLTKRQEFELSKKAKSGDLEARRKLIESNYRLVISIAKKYHRKNVDFDDLIQESTTGLLKAVDRFNPDLGHKFSTYACWWIKQAALSYINEQSGSIKVPTHSRMLNAKIRNKVAELEKIKGKKPHIEEVAIALGESVNKINYTIKANKPSVSYDNEDNEKATSIKNKLPDNSAFSDPADALERKELMQIIKNNLLLLSPKEEKIIRLRFGIEEDINDLENFPVTEEMKGYLNEK
jgi:RNA polymerase sigma factor (sigma-70 family)